jgi:uncharacterized Tic20 family protein
MPECSQCHQPVDEGAGFCSSCGAAIDQRPAQTATLEHRPAAPPAGVPAVPSREEALNWAMACHLSALFGLVFPFGNLLGPLLVWLLKKDTIPQVDGHGKESLNFQISMTIYILVATVLAFVVIGIPLLVILGVTDVILVVIAAVETKKGIAYKYPLTIRLIK